MNEILSFHHPYFRMKILPYIITTLQRLVKIKKIQPENSGAQRLKVVYFKLIAKVLKENFHKVDHFGILHLIHPLDMTSKYTKYGNRIPNFSRSDASAERSLSKIKLVKNLSQSSMGQNRLP